MGPYQTIDGPPYTVVVGWDRPVQSFFANWVRECFRCLGRGKRFDGERCDACLGEGEFADMWGTHPYEILTVDDLEAQMPREIRKHLTQEVKAMLADHQGRNAGNEVVRV